MYTTQKNITSTKPDLHEDAVCGKYTRYPDVTGRRSAEGGRRLKGDIRSSGHETPLVTVITVCWNSGKTIEHTIRTVCRQTYENIEYVIVDGQSTDNTLDIIRKYEQNIDYFVSEPDDGLYHAMNKGLELAQGEYILLLNSDDWYARHAVEMLVRAKTYSGCDFVCASARHVNDKGDPINVMRSMPFDASVYLRMPLRHETMLISSKIYNAVGPYDPTLRIIADYEFTIRLFKAGYSCYEYPRPLLFFRQSGVSNVDIQGLMKERAELMRRIFPSMSGKEISLLINRENHTGKQLLKLVSHPDIDDRLHRALFSYIYDNAAHGAKGLGRQQWREQGAEILNDLHELRQSVSPKISVILAVYAAEKTLQRCLNSVLSQTMEDFELICINDQTPDNSQEVIDEYCRRDPRVRSMINERNIGLGATRNRGIKASKGGYIFHIDPDDSIPENALETLLKNALEHDSELVRGAYLRKQFHHGIDFKPQVIHPLGEPTKVINARFADIPELLSTPEAHWAYLYRADIARRVPYPEDLKMGQDAIFLHSIIPVAAKITVIPDVVYNYMDNPKSTMNIFVLQKYLDVLEWRRRACLLLRDYGHAEVGQNLLKGVGRLHWHDRFFKYYRKNPDPSAVYRLGKIMRSAFEDAGLTEIDPNVPKKRRRFLQLLLEKCEAEAIAIIDDSASMFPKQTLQPVTKSNPKVSVILPYFNAEKTLRTCLDSVLSQSLQDIEVICINDQSPDASQAIVDEYAAHDPRIVPVLNSVNIGLGASRNRGVAKALGNYIFHVDPDDTLPPKALESIHDYAVRYGSDMTRGAYIHEQLLLGKKAKMTRKGLPEKAPHIVKTTLAKTPNLLKNTEGHWSYLYKADFAKSVFYPEDLKMGQDSIFIVNALTKAKSISVIGVLVYHYRTNLNSAMNTFNFRKYMDALEWRRRAWDFLTKSGYRPLGEYLLFSYWNEAFFEGLEGKLTTKQQHEFFTKFVSYLQSANYPGDTGTKNVSLRKLFQMKIRELQESKTDKPFIVKSMNSRSSLRIATFITQDNGGAGLGSQRRVEALRNYGVNAEIYCVFKNTSKPYVYQLPYDGALKKGLSQHQLRTEWRNVAVLTRSESPGLKARELFSKTGSIVDFRELTPVFNKADIVHFHWVSGMFDYQHAPQTLHKKPVVWTLADMNAFTGGCHYSFDCMGFIEECRNCPQLGGKSDLAHEQWLVKKRAYKNLDLNIITPSTWLAKRAAKSSLLRNRKIHVIHNAFPVEQLRLVDRVEARKKLNLPVDKKLVLFGADSLTNFRKGGDLLVDAIRYFASHYDAQNVEIVTFGAGNLDANIPVHGLGYISGEESLSVAYSAADVYLFPSREDNAPLTVGESLLCGTPVVSFPVGYVPELLAHRSTGYLAKYMDTADFAKGIKWAIDATVSQPKIRKKCRQAAGKFHGPNMSAGKHKKLYERMIATKRVKISENIVPCIHILMTSFNSEEELEKTLYSIVGQRGRFSINLNVHDRGSTDGTIDILKKWYEMLSVQNKLVKCESIRFSWYSEACNNQYKSIIRGFDRMIIQPNEFMTWIEAGNIILPDGLSVVSKVDSKYPEVQWMGGKPQSIDQNGNFIINTAQPIPTGLIKLGLCDGNDNHWDTLQQEGTFFKKRLWFKSKHTINRLCFAGDWALWREMAHHEEYYQYEKSIGSSCLMNGQLRIHLSNESEIEIERMLPIATRKEAIRKVLDQTNQFYTNIIRTDSLAIEKRPFG